MSCRFVGISVIAVGESFPSELSATKSLEPLEKNFGVPHSSVSTCANWEQIMPW